MALVYYYGRDYRRALNEIRSALGGLPNDADLWVDFGAISRRAGMWAAADSAYQQAVRWIRAMSRYSRTSVAQHS